MISFASVGHRQQELREEIERLEGHAAAMEAALAEVSDFLPGNIDQWNRETEAARKRGMAVEVAVEKAILQLDSKLDLTPS